MEAEENIRDFCQYPKCKLQSDLIYLGQGICDRHWDIVAEMPMEEAHKKMGIKQCTTLTTSNANVAEKSAQ